MALNNFIFQPGYWYNTSFTALFAASKLGDNLEVNDILKTGQFFVDETNYDGNIY